MRNFRRILLTLLLLVFGVTVVALAGGCDRHHRMRRSRDQYVRHDGRRRPPSRHHVWVDHGRRRDFDD